jgi:hypothetical protein
MALKITYIDKGVTYTDSYHRVTFLKRDKKHKFVELYIKIYSSSAYADSNPQDFYDTERIKVLPQDFDSYFDLSSWEENTLYPEKAAYNFLKTIDPDEENSNYSSLRFDYKNDATDV